MSSAKQNILVVTNLLQADLVKKTDTIHFNKQEPHIPK